MIAGEPLSVAIVDDDSVFRDILVGQLAAKSTFVLHHAASSLELVTILSSRPVDCIVLDYNLEHEDGFDVKRKISEAFSAPPPIVMLTGDSRQSTVIQALRLGISDYIPKRGLKTDDLVAAVRTAVAKGRREVAAAAERESLMSLAAVDPLTGALNRRSFQERGAAELARAWRYNRVTSVVAIDVDHFKSVNDTYGHAAGDAVLVSLALRLADCIRPSDLLGRVGGEEFAIILAETDLRNACTTAERIRVAVAALRVEVAAANIGVTISAGVAQSARRAESLETTLEKADRALYQAKAIGRNRVVATTDPLPQDFQTLERASGKMS